MLLSSTIVGLAALAIGVEAIVSATTTSTSSAAGATHTVAVGANGFVLTPAQVVNASVGDIVEFRFYPTGHWIVRSEFKQPCIPYEDTGANKVGFSSGAIAVATTSDDGPRFRVRINDTAPIFYYCAAPGSCTGEHMVGVINPNATFTYDIQVAYAENATYQMTPGEAFPSETASSTATSATGTSSSSGGSSTHLSTGAIAGIAIGGAAVAVLVAALLYMCGRRGGMDRAFHHGRMYNAGSPPMVHDGPHYAANGGGGVGPGPGPRSPGQETFVTAYSAAPSTDAYHPLPGMHQPMAGGAAPGYPPSSRSPPPMSEYSQSLYNLQGQSQHTSPLIGGMDGGHNAMQNGFYITPQVPPQQQQQQSATNFAVELPTSLNPGNSPLPGYSQQEQKTYSWAQEGEGTYRPSKP